MKKLLTTLMLGVAMLAPTVAHAADFSVDTSHDATVVNIVGEIEATDGIKFAAVASKVTRKKPVLVLLNSPGGNVLAGLEIGSMIHSKGWSTGVLDHSDTECASACTDIWLAGKTRLFSPGTKIGMHSASKDVDGKRVRADDANMVRAAYYVSLGLRASTAVAILKPDPDSIMWLTPAIANALHISCDQVS